MMAELELFPKPTADEEKAAEETQKKRKYRKEKPLDVKNIDVVRGPIYIEFWEMHKENVKRKHHYILLSLIYKGVWRVCSKGNKYCKRIKMLLLSASRWDVK